MHGGRTTNAVCVDHVTPGAPDLPLTAVTAVALRGPAVVLNARTYSAAKPSGMLSGSAVANSTCAGPLMSWVRSGSGRGAHVELRFATAAQLLRGR
jgi:hypothetical protein